MGNHGRDWKVAKQGEEELGKLNEEVYGFRNGDWKSKTCESTSQSYF